MPREMAPREKALAAVLSKFYEERDDRPSART